MTRTCENCAFNKGTIACLSYLIDEAFQQIFYPNEPPLVCENFIERSAEDGDDLDVTEIY